MELTLDADEDAVFIGVKMTESGIETSIFNMNFSTDNSRICSILALGAASSIVNDPEYVEGRGMKEFLEFSNEISKNESIFAENKEKGAPTKGNVVNFSEEAKKRKDT